MDKKRWGVRFTGPTGHPGWLMDVDGEPRRFATEDEARAAGLATKLCYQQDFQALVRHEPRLLPQERQGS